MLTLKVVTPTGVALSLEKLAEIVVRRREERFEQGSEVVLLPGHAPLLMQTGPAVIRWKDGHNQIGSQAVGEGLLQMLDEDVLLIADDG